MTRTEYRHDIAHLAHVELYTPSLDDTGWFFTSLLGMYETARSGRSIFLRGYEDPYSWSVKITQRESAGLGSLAFRTSSCAAFERRVAAFEACGRAGRYVDGEYGYGKEYEVRTPDGHPLRIVWDVEKYRAPAELRSKILTRASKKPLQGVPVKRLDHINLLASEVTPTKQFIEANLALETRERLLEGETEVGVWMSCNLLTHELGVMRDACGARGRLHHLALYYGVPQHNADAAEMFLDYGITVEAGPDRHGLTQGAFLYAFEPGGNRIELFGDCGFLEFEPDFETKTWTMADIDTVTAIGGARLPSETYFSYGTPPVEPLDRLLLARG